MRTQPVVYAHEVVIGIDAGIAFLEFHFKLLPCAPAVHDMERGEDAELCPFRVGLHLLYHILHRMMFHLHARHGAEGTAYTGIEQAQIFVDLGGSTHRRAGIARDDFLLDGDGRGKAFDKVYLRLRHSAQELAGVGRKALDVPALPFGVKRVEGQRGLTRPGHSGNGHELLLRNLHVDVPQVVDPGAFHLNILHRCIFFHSFQLSSVQSPSTFKRVLKEPWGYAKLQKTFGSF